MPRVSVVMAVFNGEASVGASVESVLGQTFGDLELVVVDDGSTDSTPEILERLAQEDRRLRILRQGNAGLTEALRRGCSEAVGEYIARQDADDVSLPSRLEQQLAWFASSPQRVLCGTSAMRVDDAGRERGRYPVLAQDATIRQSLPYRNEFVHSTVMFRRQAYEAAGGYRSFFACAQDYDLWCRLSRLAEVGNLPGPLLRFTLSEGGISASRTFEQKRFAAIAATLHWAAIKYGEELALPPLEAPVFSSCDDTHTAALNRFFRFRLDFLLLASAPERVTASFWPLLCQSLAIESWRERCRAWGDLVRYLLYRVKR